MKDYIHLAQRPFLYFWRLATSSVSARGKGQDPVRRDEKTKSVVVRRPNETSQPTTKKTKLRRAQVAKNLLNQLNLFFGLISLVGPGGAETKESRYGQSRKKFFKSQIFNEFIGRAQGVPATIGLNRPTRRYGQSRKECNVRAAGFQRGYLHRVFTENRKTELTVRTF
jgi:hypothetical protein